MSDAPKKIHPSSNPASGSLITWLNATLSFFYPEWCQLCGNARAGPSQGFVCRTCRSTVHWIEPPFCGRCGLPFPGEITAAFECSNCRNEELAFSFARSAARAHDVVLEAIHRYKYRRALWLEPFLADLLIHKALPELSAEDWNVIVPVPLHPAKRRQREFNQAERLARRLGKATGIPVNTKLLHRIVDTKTQTHLTRDERKTNMRNAFAVRNRLGLDGKRIVLVDDVLTTGATTNACAKALLKAGANEVCVWTVARGT